MSRIDELERKFEENPRRYFAPLANEYRKAGDAQRAVELCRSQLPEIPGHISGHIVLGQALYDARDFAGSRSALETALALDPENIVALRYLGDIARDTGDAAEAHRWYSRTLEADPYNEAATAALQALRDASPPTSELQPVAQNHQEIDAPSESLPSTDSVTEGFEPTPHVAEPEPPEPEPAEPQPAEPEPAEPVPAEPVTPPDFADAAPAAPSREVAPTEPIESAQQQPEPQPEAQPQPEPEKQPEPEPEPELAAAIDLSPVEAEAESGEYAGDLAISTVAESPEVITLDEAEPEAVASAGGDVIVERFDVEAHPETAPGVVDETLPEVTEPLQEAAGEGQAGIAASVHVEAVDPARPEAAEVGRADAEEAQTEELVVESAAPVVAEETQTEEVVVESAAPVVAEEIQTEELVLESAAPFVTETMADLYLEQGYPHEALELLLQLSEQRPQDEPLRAKIEHIESVIMARRDAAVAAARAERAEAVADAESGAAHGPDATSDAPFDPAVAEVDSSAFVSEGDADPLSFEPVPDAAPEEPISVGEMFARMDRARPRRPGTVSPKPLARMRSDFVRMPEAQEPDPSDDPFAFPSQPAAPEARPDAIRNSGPQPTFNPSTAGIEDFDAWLRGLRGP